MKRRQLGAQGPQVSAIGLGCMSLAGAFGPTDRATSLACLDAARDAGITFYDTANVYGPHVSEEILGDWLRTRRPDVVIATKAALTRDPEHPVDTSEAHLRAELTGSLRRLGRDRVELFYAHRRDPAMPPEELAGLMGRFIDEGLIGGYGLSEIAPATLRRAHAERPVTAVQNEYSLWTRLPELGPIQACAELGVAFVPFSPLARGALTDSPPDPSRFAEGDFRKPMPRFSADNYPRNLALIDGFRSFAKARGWTTAQAALAWVLDRGDHLIPIPGTRSAAHLAHWATAPEITLSQADRAEIARLLPPGFANGDRYSEAQARTPERYC
ncbi:MAG: putative oxidoreductase [Rhodobacteraceae bacterium HLUCCA08]|nr:MAG: putative oxidoreductase [Rhodobacteraceae bacterium HLUCCA08]